MLQLKEVAVSNTNQSLHNNLPSLSIRLSLIPVLNSYAQNLFNSATDKAKKEITERKKEEELKRRFLHD